MKKKIISPTSEEFWKEKIEIALNFCPTIYACKKCGHAVLSGYYCNTCGDSNPSCTKEQDKQYE